MQFKGVLTKKNFEYVLLFITRRSEDESVYFGGWARMAHPITSFAVVEVAKPNIGEKAPSRVRADVTVTLSVRNEIKQEWENLRKHDVCFLITVRPNQGIGKIKFFDSSFKITIK